MSGPTRLTVFLTGGAGVLGDTLIDQLAERYHLICLTRRSSINHPGVETLRGDICQPRLGLSGTDYLALTKRVDWVIHCAAITRLDGHAEAVFRSTTKAPSRCWNSFATPTYRCITSAPPSPTRVTITPG